MKYFPIFVDAEHIQCLLVGAGEVAARKCELLLKTPAKITIVAPWVSSAVEELAKSEQITLLHREFEESDLNNKQMVFVATDKPEVNQAVHDLAFERNILVNVVDNTPLCKFITPSIVDRSPIIIAMSSGGVAPVLLRYIRQKLESLIPHNIKRLGAFSERFRDKVKNGLSSVTDRRYFWEEVLDGDIGENVLQGNDDLAAAQLDVALDKYKSGDKPSGQVYLVGAGPGDPDLLTFRALRLMQKADVVVYDRLVSKDILELVRRDAEKIYVGKEKSNHTIPQADINQLLAKLALEGNRVVRLKGGDPFIFGRGGEEIETLVEQGVEFQVVPGITAAAGAASYAGIPLTHRDYAQSVTFTTGHLRDNSIDLDWPSLVKPNHTLVFYMGLTGLPIICEKLIAHNMPANTPIALIEGATRTNQKVVTGSLDSILTHPETKNLKPPTLIIVGGVVNLHEKLNWFSS